jgi:hypothetical protein
MDKTANKYQVWNGHNDCSLPNVVYYIIEFEQDEQRLIFTLSDLDNVFSIQIEFNGEIVFLRDVNESNTLLKDGDFDSGDMDFSNHNNIIFVIKNSSLMHEGRFDDDIYTHFRLMSGDSITDIITDKEPIIRRLTCNEWQNNT